MALGTHVADASGFFTETTADFGIGPLQSYSYGAETLRITATPPAPAGRTTLLGNAIRRALDARPSPASILIIGDGGSDDREELNAAARLAKAHGVPIHVHPVGGDDPVINSWIAGIRVPRTARPQATVPVRVWVGGRGISSPFTLRLVNAAGTTLASAKVSPAEKPVPVSLEITAGIRPETFRLVLERPDNDIIADDNELTFKLDVSSPKIRVLHMEGSHIANEIQTSTETAVWNAMELKIRAWDATDEIETDMLCPITQFSSSKNLFKIRRFPGGGMEFDTSHGFPKSRDEIFNYDVVICGDVPRGNFTDDEMQWVVDLVSRRGGGFCMIGGNTSFDSGDFDKTPWEKITPVDMVDYGHGTVTQHTDLFIPDDARTAVLVGPTRELGHGPEILRSTAGMTAAEMPGLSVTARLLLPGSNPERLKWDRDRREFVGSVTIPTNLNTTNVGLLFECETATRHISDHVDLPVLSLNPEIENVRATPGLLLDLAAATRGREIKTPREAVEALCDDIDRSKGAEFILLRPAWDRPGFWAIILALLASEWLLRKFARRGA